MKVPSVDVRPDAVATTLSHWKEPGSPFHKLQENVLSRIPAQMFKLNVKLP